LKKKDAPESQDTIGLDRRVNYLEQRLTTIEFTIYRLQQQITAPRSVPSTDNSELERRLLMQQVETLRSHIREIECGLAKLDERTLPSNSKTTQKEEIRNTDPCRLRPNTPLQLQSHP